MQLIRISLLPRPVDSTESYSSRDSDNSLFSPSDRSEANRHAVWFLALRTRRFDSDKRRRRCDHLAVPFLARIAFIIISHGLCALYCTTRSPTFNSNAKMSLIPHYTASLFRLSTYHPLVATQAIRSILSSCASVIMHQKRFS